MPLQITDLDQKAAFNNMIDNKPASVTFTDTDAVVQFPSGIDQKITQIAEEITEAATAITNYENEIAMKHTVIEYYNKVIATYDTEIKYSTGHHHSLPWDVTQVSKEKNLLATSSGTTSKYYPSGFTNLEISAQAADTHVYDVTSWVANSLKDLAVELDAAITSFTEAYSDTIRTNESFKKTITTTTGTPPVETTQEVDWTTNEIEAFKNKKHAINNKILAIRIAFTNILIELNKASTTPSTYPDDHENPAIVTRALTRRTEILAQQVVYAQESIPAVTVTGTGATSSVPHKYSDIVLQPLTELTHSYAPESLSNQKISKVVVASADYRQAEIDGTQTDATTVYRKPVYYSIRKEIALSLVKAVDGLYYKLISAENNKAKLIAQKASLESEKAAFASAGLTTVLP